MYRNSIAAWESKSGHKFVKLFTYTINDELLYGYVMHNGGGSGLTFKSAEEAILWTEKTQVQSGWKRIYV